MAPSPTGFLHIGGVRTFLFNWLFARGRGGECLLRIENTDTSREVAESVEQIQRSLRWLGHRLGRAGHLPARRDGALPGASPTRLVAEGKAYDDEGAIRFRMPDEGVTGWDDAVRGRIEFPNEQLEDLVIVRSDGRPTYNFASPVEDMDDEITHVIRGDDHVSNTPKQIQILRALGAELPVYAHVPDVLGDDGKKLSKRHGAQSVDEFRDAGYVPAALMNFLALLGWSLDGETTVMTPDELIERFTLERVGSSPATFDYEKLDWMNGVYLRAMSEDQYADALVDYLRDAGIDWDEGLVRRTVPLVQEKFARLGQFPGTRAFCSATSSPARPTSTEDRRRRGRGARRSHRSSLRRRATRGGAPRPRGAARPEAARGVPADPRRRHRVERLARSVREPRAPRPGRDARPAPRRLRRIYLKTRKLVATRARPSAHTGQRTATAPAANAAVPAMTSAVATAADQLQPGAGSSFAGSATGASASRCLASRTPKSAPRHSWTSIQAASPPSVSSTSGPLRWRRARARARRRDRRERPPRRGEGRCRGRVRPYGGARTEASRGSRLSPRERVDLSLPPRGANGGEVVAEAGQLRCVLLTFGCARRVSHGAPII